MTARQFVVELDQEGMRLDAFLARALPASRAEVRRLIGSGAVAANGRPVSPAEKGGAVAAGDQLSVDFTPPDERRLRADPALEVREVAVGPGFVVVDKPPGVPVHPFAEAELGTVLNALTGRFPELHRIGERGLRGGVVHRLDVDTSGVLVVATEQRSWERLRAAFRSHAMEKHYRALVRGLPPEDGRIDLEVEVVRHRPAFVKVRGGGRGITMRFRRLEVLRGAALVEVAPVTGFLHQIRVAFAHLGHPLLGDTTYGPDDAAAPRHMLHASQLAGAGVDAAAPDPPDFAETLAALR